MPLTFPKALRLTRSSDFLRIKNEGRSYPGRYMVVGVLKEAQGNRVGVITSRRVGGAVVRNRVRRRFRELLRLSQPMWQSGVWAVVIARHTAPRASYDELQREWIKLGRRAGFLMRESQDDAPLERPDALPAVESHDNAVPSPNDEKKEEASPGTG